MHSTERLHVSILTFGPHGIKLKKVFLKSLMEQN